MTSPCLTCGACCIALNPRGERLPQWVEVDRAARVPRAFVTHLPVWDGTDPEPFVWILPSGRCAALRGTVGEATSCACYAGRPKVCREYEPAGTDARCGGRCVGCRGWRW